MRKVFLCCMIVIMLICCAVPCFAIGSSSSSDSEYYPVLVWDYLSIYGSSAYYTAPYPFGNALSGGISNFDYFDMDDYPEIFGYQGLGFDDGVPRLSGNISFADFTESPSFTLSAFNKVVNVGSVSGEFYLEYDSSAIRVTGTHLTVEYYVKTQSASGDRWIFETRTASWDEYYYPNNILDVSYSFSRVSSQVGSNEIFVKSMYFTVDYSRLSANTPSFDFIVGFDDEYQNNDFVLWAYLQDLEVEVNEIYSSPESLDVVSWLSDTIEGFMSFEIFPGFSIDKLFVLVVTIGLMLWFITLLI